MSDIKLFHTSRDAVTELQGSAVALEKSLQMLIERHMEAFRLMLLLKRAMGRAGCRASDPNKKL